MGGGYIDILKDTLNINILVGSNAAAKGKVKVYKTPENYEKKNIFFHLSSKSGLKHEYKQDTIV